MSRLSASWAGLKQFGPTAAAAALMYVGTYQTIEALKYPLGGLVIGAINGVIQHRFRNIPLLPNYGLLPYLPIAFRTMAVGVSAVAAGLGVGFGFAERREGPSIHERRSPVAR